MEKPTTTKVKKFTLPRFYVRHQEPYDALTEVPDELTVNDYIINERPSTSHVDDVENKTEVDVTEVDVTTNNVDIMNEVPSTSHIDDVENKTESKVDEPQRKATKAKKPKTDRTPSAYNIFIKETCERLTKTHATITPKERYAMAIRLWNEQKIKT
jgi:hypothetical protein